jgi:hypothetical protein
VIYAPEKQSKAYDLGTAYANGTDAANALDAVLSNSGMTRYSITIFKDNVKVASINKQ